MSEAALEDTKTDLTGLVPNAPSTVATATVDVHVVRVAGDRSEPAEDTLAVEEPLEIRLAWGPAEDRRQKSLSITMRTPGDDVALAVGFLVSEGIVRAREDVESATHCGPSVRSDGTSNIVRVTLDPRVPVELMRLERHFYTTSSCGICGKTSLEAAASAAHARLSEGPRVAPSTIHALPVALRARQQTFARTGGLHACGLFDRDGKLLVVHEDVGRHNAVDKVVGAELLRGHLPLSERLLFVSGRASFELVQKALMAGASILAAVGAPSSLAIELARKEAMTVIGFVRDGRFNVYCGGERIDSPTA